MGTSKSIRCSAAGFDGFGNSAVFVKVSSTVVLCQLAELGKTLFGNNNVRISDFATPVRFSSLFFRWHQLPDPPGCKEFYFPGMVLCQLAELG